MQRRSFLGAVSCLPALALSAPALHAVRQTSAKGKPTSRSRRVGIALGGGSMHGIAHLGVLKAFAEKGLQFQFITGTSAGAIVGVLAAAQLPLGQIESGAPHRRRVFTSSAAAKDNQPRLLVSLRPWEVPAFSTGRCDPMRASFLRGLTPPIAVRAIVKCCV